MTNDFKRRLRAREYLLGLWLNLCHPTSAEICATAGFDWLLIDGEHAPNTIDTILAQLRAIGPRTNTVVRLGTNVPTAAGPLLDIGVANLLVPMVDDARVAATIVAAVRYPPRGIRGHASTLTRASGYGCDRDYVGAADDNVSVIAQIETPEAVANVHDIAAVEGVDALFIGLFDLSARLGHPNQPEHEAVQTAVRSVAAAANRAGKPVGVFAPTAELAVLARSAGCQLIAAGSDVGILAAATRALARSQGCSTSRF
ncbi:HpcH/HpaI aldolase family protein (plasmid) [Mycolicibacterium psychrotolerans]|uniref:HpcH/HpaI aldolase family protein n=1 Tax=Mycolicibacterium psychrotolerans TaxID=216929 RepID=UPI003D6750C3